MQAFVLILMLMSQSIASVLPVLGWANKEHATPV
jgi:hypothetical protein